ncbi:TonB-dependent receptor plug domain-containing protein [Sphingomonas sp. A2-49]|uniref:TonB-dependent receptor n=1 Tax=Sphingomonas sp. A2-49 TaxID=1391375 RepID=UPI0021D35BF3|nr:TonB-dependent receptor plug domain-containing protein [Sphingomonas sp. A2-49]MCU6455549.1 TonB-dependent receptor plug domain-containing protein [Sphingomonas sp. A2-49]
MRRISQRWSVGMLLATTIGTFAICPAAAQSSDASVAPAAQAQSGQDAAGQDVAGQGATGRGVGGEGVTGQGATGQGAIGDIVVTARRKDEKLQQVPLAVTAFDQAALDRGRVQSLFDLQQSVPSLNVNGQFNRNQEIITLRGQTETGLSTGGGAGGGPSVVSYVSEVPVIIAGPGIYYDLQSVQVLKGPQGTLFGRNTTGGAILFEPQRPGYEFGGFGQVTVGDFRRAEFVGAVNVPIVSDALALRVAGQIGRRDGYTRDVGTGIAYENRHYNAFRVGLLAQPVAGFENYLLANYVDYDERSPGMVLIGVNPAIRPEALPFFQAQQARGVREINQGIAGFSQGRTLNVINKTTVSLGDAVELKNIASYSRRQYRRAEDGDATPLPIVDSIGSYPGTWNTDVRTITEELRLAGKSFGDLSWQFGGYYEHNRNPRGSQTFIQRFGANYADAFRLDLVTRTIGVYAQGTIDLSRVAEGLKFTAGYRHTWDEITQGIALAGSDSINPKPGDPCLTRFGSVYPDCYISASTRHDGDSYNVSLDYQITPRTLLYAATRQGYKSGGFNIISAVLGQQFGPYFRYRPERVRDIEGGLKTEWSFAGINGRSNLAVYKSWYDDAQVLTVAVIAGSPQGLTANGARASIQGIELENRIKPGRNVEMNLSYSLIDAQYKNYVTPLGRDLTDLPFALTPRIKVSAGARVRLPLPDKAGAVWAGATYSYQSSVYSGIGDFGPGSPTNRQPAYGLLNLRLDWTDALGSRIDLGAFVTNATNKVYYQSELDFYNATGLSVATFGEPRMYGLSVRRAF